MEQEHVKGGSSAISSFVCVLKIILEFSFPLCFSDKLIWLLPRFHSHLGSGFAWRAVSMVISVTNLLSRGLEKRRDFPCSFVLYAWCFSAVQKQLKVSNLQIPFMNILSIKSYALMWWFYLKTTWYCLDSSQRVGSIDVASVCMGLNNVFLFLFHFVEFYISIVLFLISLFKKKLEQNGQT